MTPNHTLTTRNKRSHFLRNVHSFLVLFFERVNIHGFSYFGLQYLQILEKYNFFIFGQMSILF